MKQLIKIAAIVLLYITSAEAQQGISPIKDCFISFRNTETMNEYYNPPAVGSDAWNKRSSEATVVITFAYLKDVKSVSIRNGFTPGSGEIIQADYSIQENEGVYTIIGNEQRIRIDQNSVSLGFTVLESVRSKTNHFVITLTNASGKGYSYKKTFN